MNFFINPLHCIDFYKADHRRQYPKNTTEVYSNFTARSGKLAKDIIPNFNGCVLFVGLQYYISSFLTDSWNINFFNKDINEIKSQYQKRMDGALGKGLISTGHIESLHKLGYLPIKIKALPEGSLVPIGVPILTIINTHPNFFWLTNYLETSLSSYLWRTITSATIAYEYRRILEKYALLTGADKEFIKFQAHDFSFRGQPGVEAASLSGLGHLSCFFGTDTIPAIDLVERYYYPGENELIGCSVPATEHSVMCMGEKEGEIETLRRLIEDVYPSGLVSIVSDTWDLWKLLLEYLPLLKNKILKRDGKVVIRPDSGDPVKIICGDKDYPLDEPAGLGVIEILWNIFGGTVNEKGYKKLDAHIGVIYGDSITLERAESILDKLKEKGFSSDNIVFGVGSYTYQHVTRDTFGFAMKSTSGVVNGERKDIFKDPITDNGVKKSAKGLLRIEMVNDKFVLFDRQDNDDGGELNHVYHDHLLRPTSIKNIRNRVDSHINKEINIQNNE